MAQQRQQWRDSVKAAMKGDSNSSDPEALGFVAALLVGTWYWIRGRSR